MTMKFDPIADILADILADTAALTSTELAALAADAADNEAQQAEVAALNSRIDYEVELAKATGHLLYSIRCLCTGGMQHVGAQQNFADFRKELQPLAETYGVKIVLVGNKKTATLVK